MKPTDEANEVLARRIERTRKTRVVHKHSFNTEFDIQYPTLEYLVYSLQPNYQTAEWALYLSDYICMLMDVYYTRGMGPGPKGSYSEDRFLNQSGFGAKKINTYFDDLMAAIWAIEEHNKNMLEPPYSTVTEKGGGEARRQLCIQIDGRIFTYGKGGGVSYIFEKIANATGDLEIKAYLMNELERLRKTSGSVQERYAL
jgi:hypothetical protein